MAGLWPASRTLEIGIDGRPASRRAYFYEAGTLNPLTTYNSASLGAPHPAYVETDLFGRWPAVYFDEADGFYRVRVTDGGSTVLYDDDAVPIIGPSEGGGGSETPVDPDALAKTGDYIFSHRTGTRAGCVRANGRTIGSAVSGATERANADTQALFEYLWTTDANLAVSGGRGANATADFEGNKTIALPDFSGKAPIGLDNLSGSAAGVLTGLTTLGQAVGSQTHTLTEAELPAVTITGTTESGGAHTHDLTTQSQVEQAGHQAGNRPSGNSNETTGADSTSAVKSGGAHTHDFSASFGSGDPHSIVQPGMGISIYIKL